MPLPSRPNIVRENVAGVIGALRTRLLGIALAIVFATAGLALTYHYWPRRLNLPPLGVAESVTVSRGGTRIFVRGQILIGELAKFDDGLFAFLMFDYLRGRPALAGKTLVLAVQEEQGQPLYRIFVRLPPDLLEGINILTGLKSDWLARSVSYRWIVPSQFESYVQETSAFVAAYSGPATQRLKTLHASQLQGYLRNFIRFKSETDPRAASGSEPVPSPLTSKDAGRLAGDIMAVAHFYGIPIDLLLGIGAMENNYLNVAGDLKNTIWKASPQPGDIVLRRRGSRVLVRNESRGVWQITQESLRFAHRLYLSDKRDYQLLPERLRPPARLDVNSVDSEVLTTYAGLLLRNLLDQFNGDVSLAAGAYNGGPGNPNAKYAAGVEIVANYARRVIGRAAEIDRIGLEGSSVSARKIKSAYSH